MPVLFWIAFKLLSNKNYSVVFTASTTQNAVSPHNCEEGVKTVVSRLYQGNLDKALS